MATRVHVRAVLVISCHLGRVLVGLRIKGLVALLPLFLGSADAHLFEVNGTLAKVCSLRLLAG